MCEISEGSGIIPDGRWCFRSNPVSPCKSHMPTWCHCRKKTLEIFLTNSKLHRSSNHDAGPGPRVDKCLTPEYPPQPLRDSSIRSIIEWELNPIQLRDPETLWKQQSPFLLAWEDDARSMDVPLSKTSKHDTPCMHFYKKADLHPHTLSPQTSCFFFRCRSDGPSPSGKRASVSRNRWTPVDSWDGRLTLCHFYYIKIENTISCWRFAPLM